MSGAGEEVPEDDQPMQMSSLSDDSTQISRDRFTEISAKILTDSICIEHIRRYPDSQLSVKELNRYFTFKGIDIDQELDTIRRAFNIPA